MHNFWPTCLPDAAGWQTRRAAVLLLVLVLVLGVLRAAAAPLAPPVVRALLGPEPRTVPAYLADIARLRTGHAIWAADGLNRLLVYGRLAQDFQQVQQPDSAYRCLLRARREAMPRRRTYPLEVADVLGALGAHHFSAVRLDSAGRYYRAAADVLLASGLDLRHRTLVRRANGQRVLPGPATAGLLANAGLVQRRRGELTAALQLYEQALDLQRALSDEPGLRWTQCLIGEAYEDQGDGARALAYYQQAAATAHTVRPGNEAIATGQLVDIIGYARHLLLTRHHDRLLRQWCHEALQSLHRLEARDSATAFPKQAADVHLTLAIADLHGGQPESAAAALAAADSALVRFRRRGGSEADWREKALYRAGCWMQYAYAAYQPAAEVASYRRQALAGLAALAPERVRARARARLADALLAVGDGATAAEVLRPLVPLYAEQGARLFLRDTYALLRRAYAQERRYDSAFVMGERYRLLSDTLRAADQYAALAATAARYRTREQAQQIRQLTETAARQRQRQTLIGAGGLALLLVLAGVVWAWRRTRHLNQRLAALDQLKNQFFANVSHELRTPLTLLVGPAEHLLAAPAGHLSAYARKSLTLLARNGQRLQRLVNQLLDLTKLEAGRLRPVLAPVRPVLLIGQLVDGCRPLADVRSLRLTAELRVRSDLTVWLDADRLDHIVSNLLANALRFTPAGGCVTVTLTAPTPTELRVDVRDTGPGIAEAEQTRVFERFYQVAQPQASGGTGIGLALARELAELLGGTLTLASRPGEGSTFSLRLAAAAVEDMGGDGEDVEDVEGVAEGRDVADGAVNRPRILIVEDHADLRAFLRQVLEPRYEVLEAPDGRAALTLLATETVDLISSDEMMPGMSGTELFAALRGQPVSGPRVPFLLLTARAEAQHRLAALELGVDDYLHKPFLPRELLARVQNLLTNYRERQRWRLDLPDGESDDGPALLVSAPAVAATVSFADQDLLRRLRALTDAALADAAFDTEALVEELGVSKRTLYRKLKELAGLTPAAYLREVRLDRARHLLEQGAYQTVAEVAFAVGFDDAQYFARLFHKHYGKRATEYLRG